MEGPHVLTDYAKWQSQWLCPLPLSKWQRSVTISAGGARCRGAVEVCRATAAPSLSPSRHRVLHLLARIGTDLAHDLLNDLDPLPYLT